MDNSTKVNGNNDRVRPIKRLNPDQYVNIREAAEVLDIHPESTRRLIRHGCLKARKFGGQYLINHEYLKEYAKTYDGRPGNVPRVTKRRKKIDDPGFVYILVAANGLRKIGKNRDPQSRYKDIDTSSPIDIEIEVLFSTDDMTKLEIMIHAVYEARRVKGEWFDIGSEEVEDIKKRAMRFNARIKNIIAEKEGRTNQPSLFDLP